MPTLTCPSCHSPLQPHAEFGTETIVCGHCRALVGIDGSQATPLGRQDESSARLASEAPLRLGARGTLRGKPVTVTGILERADGDYTWHEIAIADAAGDVGWLWVDRGHFSLGVCEGKQCVSYGADHHYHYQGHKLALFNKGKARVVAAVGEFPFKIDAAALSEITDYIAPPYVASFEDAAWWVFEYVPLADIERAFGVSCPAPVGIGINQPAPYQRQRRAFGLVTVAALLAAILIHFAAGRAPIAAPLVAGTVDLLAAKDAPPESFGPFTLERRWNSLEVEVHAPVVNAWADLTLALVSQETGRSYWTSRGVEFYRGVDSDGPWTEGSTVSTALVRSIPAGTYVLLAHGEAGTWNQGSAPPAAEVRIFDHPAPTSNLLLAIVAVLGVAGLYLFAAHRFESARWQMSDYEPKEYT